MQLHRLPAQQILHPDFAEKRCGVSHADDLEHVWNDANLSGGLLRRCQDLTQLLAGNVVDSNGDQVDVPPLDDMSQILPPAQNWQSVNPLPTLARIVINEADQVVDFS